MKQLSCEYNKNLDNPWECEVCSGTDCDKIRPSSEVNFIRPESLEVGFSNINATISRSVSCERDEVNKVLNCGEEKDHVLKMTNHGNLKLMKKPSDLSMFSEEGGDSKMNYINQELFGKELSFLSGFDPYDSKGINFLINSDLVDGTELYSLKILGKDLIPVRPNLKEDFSDEYENLEFQYSTIDPKYRKRWGLTDAFREWLANAFDVSEDVDDIDIHRDKNGNWVLEYKTDHELKLKHLLVLGSHETVDEKQIGRFGEGITIGSLDLARKGIPVKIEAIGKTYYVVLKENEKLESELLHAYHEPNNRTHGTKITLIGMPNKSVLDAKNSLLPFRKDYHVKYKGDVGEILEFTDNTKRLAIKNMVMQKQEDRADRYLFSYHMYDEEEELMNVERDVVASDKLERKIVNLLEKIDDVSIIRKIVKAYAEGNESNYLDLQNKIMPTETRELWRKEILDYYSGKRIAIKSSYADYANENVSYMGYEVVDWNFGNSILIEAGFERAENIPGAEGKPRVMRFDELTAHERENFQKIVNNSKNLISLVDDRLRIKKFYDESKALDEEMDKIRVAETFEGCKEMERYGYKINGLYRDGVVYLHRDTLNDVAEGTGTLIHEWMHKFKGFSDSTRKFEGALSYISGKTTDEWQGTKRILEETKKALNDCDERVSDKTYWDKYKKSPYDPFLDKRVGWNQ